YVFSKAYRRIASTNEAQTLLLTAPVRLRSERPRCLIATRSSERKSALPQSGGWRDFVLRASSAQRRGDPPKQWRGASVRFRGRAWTIVSRFFPGTRVAKAN